MGKLGYPAAKPVDLLEVRDTFAIAWLVGEDAGFVTGLTLAMGAGFPDPK